MKKPNTIKLRTVQSGIEAELRSTMSRKCDQDDYVGGPITLTEKQYNRVLNDAIRKGIRHALFIVNAQFESYR